MIHVFISVLCVILFILPMYMSLFGRILIAFVASVNWVYGIAVINGRIDHIGSVRFYTRLDPPLAGGETATAFMLLLLAFSAAIYNSRSTPNLFAAISSIKVPKNVFWFVFLYASVAGMVTLANVGVGTLMDYSGYGSIKERHEIYSNSATLKFFAMTFRLSSIVLIALACTNFIAGKKRYFWLALPIMVIAVLVGISEASRIGAVYMILAAIIFFSGKRYVVAVGLACFGLVSIAYALEARGHYNLGLLYFFEYAGSALVDGDLLHRILANTSAGMITTSASLNVGNPDLYKETFKILSFMPTVDAIDGFQSVKADNEQRILLYIPYNAFAEAWLFGPLYFMLFWSVLFLAMRSVGKSANINPMIHFVLMALFFLALMIASQYPIRNCLRYFYLIVLLEPILGKMQSRISNRRRRNRLYGVFS